MSSSLIACHEQVRIAGPQWPDQRAYLLIVTTDEGTSAWAIDVLAGLSPGGPDLSLRGRAELVTVHLGCPLSSLDLTPGPVALLEQPLDEIPLPLVLGAQTTRIEDGATGPWQTIAPVENVIELPASAQVTLRRLPIEQVPSECEGRTPRIATTPGFSETGGYSFSVPLNVPPERRRLLVGTRTGESYLITPEGDRTSNVLPEGVFVAGHEADDGTLYLLRDDGFLVYGPREGPFQTSTSSLAMRQVDAGREQLITLGSLAGGRRADGTQEVFAATGITVAYFDGDDWVQIVPSSEQLDLLPPGPDLLWLGPGAALVGDSDEQEGVVVEIENYIAKPSGRPVSGLDQVRSLVRTSDDKIWLGTRLGRVFQYIDGEWDLKLSDDRRIPTTFLQTEFGLLIGRNDGILGGYQWTWYAGDGVCAIAPENLPSVLAVWKVGDRRWMTVNRDGSTSGNRFGTGEVTISAPLGAECSLGNVRLATSPDE